MRGKTKGAGDGSHPYVKLTMEISGLGQHRRQRRTTRSSSGVCCFLFYSFCLIDINWVSERSGQRARGYDGSEGEKWSNFRLILRVEGMQSHRFLA